MTSPFLFSPGVSLYPFFLRPSLNESWWTHSGKYFSSSVIANRVAPKQLLPFTVENVLATSFICSVVFFITPTVILYFYYFIKYLRFTYFSWLDISSTLMVV